MKYKITVRVKIAGLMRQRTFIADSDLEPEELAKSVERDYDMFKDKPIVTVRQVMRESD